MFDCLPLLRMIRDDVIDISDPMFSYKEYGVIGNIGLPVLSR